MTISITSSSVHSMDRSVLSRLSGSETESGTASEKTSKKDSAEKTDDTSKTDEKDQKEIEKLKKRDREVRIHEQAHAAAGGAYVSGAPSYDYKTGPDGKKYAVGGEVQLDMSKISGDPRATAQKMRVVKNAALAPAEPSAKDRSVAAEASIREMKAMAEYRKASYEQSSEQSSKTAGEDTPGQSVNPIEKQRPAAISTVV